MKRFFLLLMSLVLVGTSCVMGADKVVVEENYARFINIEPQVVNGSLYLPVRDMAETCGYALLWNGEAKDVIISGESKKVVINIRDNTCNVDGVQQNVDVVMLNSYSLIPIELWGEIFDKYVYWDSNESVGAVVTPQDITMEEYLQLVEYCGRLMLFNSAYAQVKAETTVLIDSYAKTKDTQLLAQIKEDIDKDLTSALEEIKAIEVPDFAVAYKADTVKLCQVKYDYINYYFDNIEGNRNFEEPVSDLRDEIVRQNVIVTAQLKGFFKKTAVIQGLEDIHLKEVGDFSHRISEINEEMLSYLYHIDSTKDFDSELVKYGEALQIYSREYKIRLKDIAETTFSDDTFADNVMAIDYILESIGQVGKAYVKAGNGEYSLDRAVLEENYIDFIWENINMFVIAEHFGFSFDYIYTPDMQGVLA